MTRYAYVTKRQAPQGYVAVTRPYAAQLYEQGMAITLCGNNVKSFHVFQGWHLGHTIQQGTCKEHYAWQESFEHICRSFLSYLEPELGTYVVYYVKAETIAGRKADFPRVTLWTEDRKPLATYEDAWSTIVGALNTGKPLIA